MRTATDLHPSLERLCRGLLTLVRTVRVYPQGHPALEQTAGRALRAADELGLPLRLGIAPDRVLWNDAFWGGPRTRTAELAAFLHGRRIGALEMAPSVTPGDLLAFARELGEAAGADLVAHIARSGVAGVSVRPLDLARVHEGFEEARQACPPGPDGARGEAVWAWLLSGPPARGPAPAADGLPELPARWAALLRAERERLDAALAALPPDDRAAVTARLEQLGRQLSPEDVAAILDAAGEEGALGGELVGALLPSLEPERLLDILAALVRIAGADTQRLADVYRRLYRGTVDEVLEALRGRSPGAGAGTEVLRAVETFLLDLREERFMDAGYAREIERAAAARPRPEPAEELAEDPEEHLDRVAAALVESGDLDARRLVARIEGALEAGDLPRALSLAEAAGRIPSCAEAMGRLAPRLFAEGIDGLRRLDPAGRDALCAVFRQHEQELLSPALRALASEQRMAARRFLVRVLSGSSPAATPRLVARLRAGPWYVTRNLAIVLGNRGDPRSVPALRALARHDHPKVRREAVLALGRLGTDEARRFLEELRRAGTPEERDLAVRALRETEGTP